MTTLVQTRVKIVTEADGKAHIYEQPSYRRLATEGSVEEAECRAVEQGWYVVNPRPLGWPA